MKYLLLFVFSMSILFASDSTKTYKMDQVVVTGTRAKQEKNELSSTITVIEQSEIRNSSEYNILPVIGEKVPGVFIQDRGTAGYGIAGGSGGSITIRGISGTPNTGVLILIDGQPQFMGIFGHPISDAYAASDIERVEVIRGPASILYGTNALGGAVNIITKETEKDGYNFDFEGSYGSHNTQYVNLGSSFKSGKFSTVANINYNNSDGIRENRPDAFNTIGGYFKASYDINDNYDLSMDFNISDSEFNDPGSQFDGVPADSVRNYTRGRAALKLDNQYEKLNGSLRFFYNFGEHSFSNGFHSNDVNAGLTFYQNMQLFKGNTFTLGVDYKNYGGTAENKTFGKTLVDQTIAETEAYAYLQQKLFEKLNLSAGYRFTQNRKYGHNHTPYAGLTYNLDQQNTVRASFSQAFRSPTLLDLFLFNAANDELEPENVTNYELGWETSLFAGKVSLEATLFHTEGSNMIVPVFQPSNQIVQKLNSGELDNNGIELGASWHPAPSLSFSSVYSFVDTKEPTLLSPKHNLNTHFSVTKGILGIKAGVKYIGGLYTNTSEDNRSKEDYVLLNTRIDVNVYDNIYLYLRGENLLDQQYQIDYGYPMPGATFNVGVRASLR